MKNRLTKRTALLTAGVAALLCAASCNKQPSPADIPAGHAGKAALSGVYSNLFGVLINKSAADTATAYTSSGTGMSLTRELQLANDYGVHYFRMNLYMDKWNDAANGYQNRSAFLADYNQVNNAGLSVLLNLNSTSPAFRPAPFPDSAVYAAFVRNVLDSLSFRPGLVVIENEECNEGYFTLNSNADVLKYSKELYAGAQVCAGYTRFGSAVGVTNGGVVCRLLTLLAWDWMKNTKNWPAKAKSFAFSSMSPSFYYALYPANTPPGVTPKSLTDINDAISRGKAFMNGYTAAPLSYINIHWYEPARVRGWSGVDGGNAWTSNSKDDISSGALDSVVLYLNAKLPSLAVVSNETGQLSHSPCLTAAMFRHYVQLGFPVVSWYDGDGGSAYDSKALHNTSGGNYTLRQSGDAFQQSVSGSIPVCP